ncbi:MAG TPA: ribosome biogenesis GTP-binding protein YihA/YsxC [Rhizomicrobium sp.]|jgi:GTP-binding protein|nr:ribosome biogenesis GTP-binding protein YihA/YsxC [Rhizomicrobium sp.]
MTADASFARKLFSGSCEFVAGAMSLDALPETGLPEVAFVGRSNAGKSSLINALTGRTSLARVSHTPGRTRQINLFRLRDVLVLADLPGYGFARVSKVETAHWNALITGYLHTRHTLRRVVLLLDARRGIMASDKEAMGLLDGAAVSYQLVLTKADALKPAALEQVMANVHGNVALHPAALAGVIATSARSSLGIAELRQSLAELANQ